ncbi:hypothetical protein T439DRAFT_376792 [Meredithblackwellia eburnea MCA 4105]
MSSPSQTDHDPHLQPRFPTTTSPLSSTGGAITHDTPPQWANTNVVPGVAADYDPLWDDHVHQKGEGVMARREEGGEGADKGDLSGRGRRKKWIIVGSSVLFLVVVVAAVVGGVVGSRSSARPGASNSTGGSNSASSSYPGGTSLRPVNISTLVTQTLPSTTYGVDGGNGGGIILTTMFYTTVIPVSVESVTPRIITTTAFNNRTVTAIGYPVQVTVLDSNSQELSEYPTTIVGSTIGASAVASTAASTRGANTGAPAPSFQTSIPSPTTSFITSIQRITSISFFANQATFTLTTSQTVVGYETIAAENQPSTFVPVSTISPLATPPFSIVTR